MQVSEKIDQLINSLQQLKPSLTNNNDHNRQKFDDILETSLRVGQPQNNESSNTVVREKEYINGESIASMKSKVSSDYGGGKPNMRQFIEILSGEKIETLQNTSKLELQNYRDLARELLYGVVGSNTDTRDWTSIMSSNDIISSARKATGAMYQPVVDISNELDNEKNVVTQFAVLKDKSGAMLRALHGSTSNVEKSLINFGATDKSIPQNLASRIIPGKFDMNILKTLTNFPHAKTLDTFEAIVLKSKLASVSGNIPQEELNKL